MEKGLNQILKGILETKNRNNEQEEKKFLALVNQTFDYMDVNVARVLMKTFMDKPDYGTQERVIGAILKGGREIYIQAILEELPRLQAEAPAWVETLLCPEIEHHPDILGKIAHSMPENIKKILKVILNDEEILSEYPNAKKITL